MSNFELQAILDAPDSDSSSQDDDDAMMGISSVLQKSSPSSRGLGGIGVGVGVGVGGVGLRHRSNHLQDHDSDINLEKILREHDEDDDDDDFDFSPHYHTLGEGGGVRSNHNHAHNNQQQQSKSHHRNTSDDHYSVGGSTISTRTNLFPQQTSPQHSSNASTASPARRSQMWQVNDMPRVREETITTGGTHATERSRSESLPVPVPTVRTSANTVGKGGVGSSTLPRNNQNPEEWMMLQNILNEADDDDDDDDDIHFSIMENKVKSKMLESAGPSASASATSSLDPKSEMNTIAKEFKFGEVKLRRAPSNTSSVMDVDAIINAMDTDSDDDDAADLAELDEMIARFSMNVNKASSQSVERSRSSARSRSALPTNPASKWIDGEHWQQQQQGGNKIQSSDQVPSTGKGEGTSGNNHHRPSQPNKWTPSNSTTVNKYLQQYSNIAQSKSDVVSEAALKTAEEYERKLLRPGQRDIVSPLMVKRRMKPKIELQTKSRRSQPQSSSCPKQTPSKKKMNGLMLMNSSQHPRFNFSGMIESKYMQRLSSELQRSVPNSGEDVGLPTALAIGDKFIAVGTQRGIVLVFDLFEELRQELGLGNGGEASAIMDQFGSVSSIDLASDGENLVAGYTNGSVVIWDVIKGVMVKAVTDLHPSPITIVRFISEKALNVVSVDAGGLVNKLAFVKTMLWSTINVENECLLDGSAGQILAMDVLAPIASLKTMPLRVTEDKKKRMYHHSIHKLVLLALSSERSSFAIAVEPSVSVLHRWAKPTDEQMNLTPYLSGVDGNDNGDDGNVKSSSLPGAFLPCLSWGWALVSGGENSVTPILARAWGCYVQLLRANFPPREDDDDGKTDDIMHWPAFGVHDEFDIAAPVVALEWLGDRSLVFLSLTNELTIVDTVMMTLTERLDFSGVKLVYAEFALSRSAASGLKDSSNGEPCISTTFQNSIRSSEDRLLVLCPKEVKTLSILGIQQRMSVLEESGEWLEALALALDHYESTIKSQEDRKRNPGGSRDVSNHPEFISRIRLTEDEEWIGDLLLRYLTLAVDNAPEATLNTNRSNRIDLALSHYQMLAGVCIEFCVITRRLDLLFNEIYQCFSNTGYTAVFLDILEPYVLNDKLKYIAPVVMSEFIEHYKALNDIAVVERCLLHMDVTIMDFDTILSLLRKNSMFSALIHVYTQGLDDYLSPLELLFDAFFDAADSCEFGAGSANSDRFGSVERFGYKIILYLRHCFTKKTFPTGMNLAPEDRITTMRPELLRLLIRKVYEPISFARSLENAPADCCRQKQYPYIHLLMQLDSKAFCDTLSIVFDDPEVQFKETNDNQETFEAWRVFESQDSAYGKEESGICPDRMVFLRRMAYVLSDNNSLSLSNGTFSNESLDNFFDFTAKYLLTGVVRAPPPIISSVISRMASRLAQDEIIKLLQVLPRNSYKRENILDVVEASQMSRAALILHKGGVSDLFDASIDSAAFSNHFMCAIDCYLKDDDPRFQREVFDYVKNECIGGSTSIINCDRYRNKEATVHDILRNALCEKLPKLINLDPVPCAQLVAEIYVEELEQILAALETTRDEIVQFKFFNAIISGNLTKVDAMAGPVLLANLTIDHHQKYLELMAKFYPDMVYHHLISSDNYRVEECLKLCQEYEIADASAYLLERMGNVSSALQLMLQTLEGRLMTLKRVVRGLVLAPYNSRGRLKFSRNKVDTQKMVANLHQEKESQAVQQILTFGLDLCERNSGTSSQTEHGSQLWFNVLDRLINAKGFLRLSKELPEHSSMMLDVLSDLLRITMQRMVSNVPLPDLVRRITTDHAGNQLGEFREMITTMLNTYISEMDVCSGAVAAIHYDVRRMSVSKFNLKICGTKVHNVASIQKEKRRAVDILSISSRGNASFMNQILSSKSKEVAPSAISRLREKRHKKLSQKTGVPGKLKVGQGMLTTSDKLFQMGESSDAAFMSRCIGMLSEAEHFGRLRYM